MKTRGQTREVQYVALRFRADVRRPERTEVLQSQRIEVLTKLPKLGQGGQHLEVSKKGYAG